MDLQELKTIISDAVKEQTAPLLETQRKYADDLIAVKTQQEKEEHFQSNKSTEAKEPGMTFTRAIKCLTLAKNDADKALFYAGGGQNSSKGMYPNDKEVHALLKQLSASTPSEGGFLIGEQYSADIIPLLLSKTVIMELGARHIPMPNGNLNLPKLTGGATAYYQGENQNSTKSQQTFGNVKLSSKKLVTLVPVSNDLIRNSSYAADMLIRDDMVNQMKLKIDYTSLYGDGTAYTPLGIKSSVYTGNITIASAAATLSGDILGSMLGTLMGHNTPMLSVGWVINSQIWAALYNN